MFPVLGQGQQGCPSWPPTLGPSQATLAGLAAPQVAALLLCFPLLFLVPQMRSRETCIYFFLKRTV